MILIDITGLSNNINSDDIITFRLVNTYKNYNTTNTPFLNQNIPINTYVEKTAKVIKFLGEGSYGKVYKIKIDDEFYALKVNENEDPLKLYERYDSLRSNSKLEKYIIKIFCAGEIKSRHTYSFFSIMEYG